MYSQAYPILNGVVTLVGDAYNGLNSAPIDRIAGQEFIEYTGVAFAGNSNAQVVGLSVEYLEYAGLAFAGDSNSQVTSLGVEFLEYAGSAFAGNSNSQVIGQEVLLPANPWLDSLLDVVPIVEANGLVFTSGGDTAPTATSSNVVSGEGSLLFSAGFFQTIINPVN